MVRLRVQLKGKEPFLKRSFNSKMVRLRVSAYKITANHTFEFQFQNGAIERPGGRRGRRSDTRFNSKMVRLRDLNNAGATFGFRRFNSKMVRLRATFTSSCTLLGMRFNSKMVRLRVRLSLSKTQ